MQSISKLQRMGRRRFLKTMSGLGVSAASLPHLTKDALADSVDSAEDEIPYIARYRHTNHEEVENGAQPEREPIWDTVGREHWKRTEVAHNAMEALNTALTEQFGSSNIIAGVTSETDKYDKKIIVEYREIEHRDGTVATPSPSFTEFERTLPSTVRGEVVSNGSSFSQDLEVIPKRIRQRRMCGGGYFDDEYGTNIPGGVTLTAGLPPLQPSKTTLESR